MTQALDYGKRAERQRSEEPDVDPQVRFCERGRPRGRSLLDPVVRAEGAQPPDQSTPRPPHPGRGAGACTGDDARPLRGRKFMMRSFRWLRAFGADHRVV